MTLDLKEPVALSGQQKYRLLLRVPEVASALALSRAKVYELLAAGELPVVRVGRATRVPLAALQAWVATQTSECVTDTEFTGT